MNREEQNKKDWIDKMVKELNTEKKIRDDLECYYNLIQVNQKLITILSNGLLSKPNYTIEVFEEFLEKYKNKEIYDIVKEKIGYIRIQFEDEEILDEYCCELKNGLKDVLVGEGVANG